MKFLFLFFFTLTSFFVRADVDAVALRRSNGLLRFIAHQEGLRNYALNTIIGARCARYLNGEEKDSCKETVKKMLLVLDYDVIFKDALTPNLEKVEWTPSSFLFVAFKQKLISLLNDPKTKTYLYDLNQQLYDYLLNEDHPVNIWELSKKHFLNEYSASMAIAVLFQDTSKLKLHIGYLEHERPQGPKIYQDNLELLGRVIDTINLVLDNSEENYRKLFYPASIQKDLNKNIYHFYVPLFLARALEREGVSKDDAYVATLMLTLTYEFITVSGSYTYVLKDPEMITDPHSVKDIFGGYWGSRIGVSGLMLNLTFDDLLKTFSHSTRSGVELLLTH